MNELEMMIRKELLPSGKNEGVALGIGLCVSLITLGMIPFVGHVYVGRLGKAGWNMLFAHILNIFLCLLSVVLPFLAMVSLLLFLGIMFGAPFHARKMAKQANLERLAALSKLQDDVAAA